MHGDCNGALRASREPMWGPEPLDQCVSSETVACCTGSACSELSLSPASAVDACKQAIDAEDCYSMTINAAPDACAGIPQKP